MYEQIAANKRKSFFVCFVFLVLIGALGWVFATVTGFGWYWGVGIAAVIALIMSWTSYYYSDRIVLAMSKAHPIEPDKYPKHKFLANEVEGLSLAAGFQAPPKCYIIDDSAPNAFATGRNPEHGVVCVTTGLLDKLDRYELQGVLAHEMSHIKNYDILLQTIVVVMVGVAVLLSDTILRVMWYTGGRGGRRRRSSSDRGGGQLQAVLIIVGLILAILTPIIAQMLRFWVSRKREFLADADGAMLTRYPEGLARALEKISGDREPLEVANKATAHMYIVNPLAANARASGRRTSSLFSTHPPTRERIAALRSMGGMSQEAPEQ